MSSPDPKTISEAIAKNRPDYASLFGSLELCDCQHCRSIYSPAAYLVELLEFLRLGDLPGSSRITPLDMLIGNDKKMGGDGKPLIGRRPDIAQIALSCENTNTTLPYVDLVNEVLESYIVFNQTLPQVTTNGKSVPKPNESSIDVTAAELSANPENTRDRAYDRLEAEVYPFTLPFNQPINALRLTLEAMGSSRHEVMDVFGPQHAEAKAARRALDAEALKLTEHEFAILTKEKFDGKLYSRNVSDFYGFEQTGAADHTAWVKGSVPPGALQKTNQDTWAFTEFDPQPRSKVLTHASTVAVGLHEHSFEQATVSDDLKIGAEDFMYAEIFLDPANVPDEVMLQWNDGTWDHRAYWSLSKSKMGLGVEGTANCRYMGALPQSGSWQRLEVPAALVGLADRQVSGVAFTLFGGGATWGEAGKSASWIERLSHVPTLLARAGITYVELVELLRTKYLNQALPSEALTTFERIPISYRALGRLVANDFEEIDVTTLDALAKVGMTREELKDWAKLHYASVGPMLVLEAPDSVCDLTLTWLNHLNGTLLGEDDLDRLHRFIRLWRKLGWSMQDLDRALFAFGATDITADFVRQLSHLVQLQKLLNLPIQKLLSFWGNIPTTGDKSLYSTLFLNKAVREIDPVFAPVKGKYLATDRALKIEEHIPALLAALRTRATDLALIRKHTNLDASDDLLTVATATILYRYVTLARAMKMSVKDFIDLEVLSGVKPFSSLDRPLDGNAIFKDLDPARTLEFARIAARLDQSGFNSATLRYLFNKKEDSLSTLAPSDEQIQLVLKGIREGLIRITAENVTTEDPTGEVTRAKLGLLFEPHIVEQITGLIARPQTYSVPLAARPGGVSLPADKVTYDDTNLLLTASGWLTDAEMKTLPDPDEYKKAMQSLYDQPRNLIDQTFAKVLGWSSAVSVMEALLVIAEEIGGLVTQTNSAPLAALPDNLKLPNEKVTYDAVAHVLNVSGWLTETEKDDLLKLSDVDDYENAVKFIAEQQLKRVKGFLEGLGWIADGPSLKAKAHRPEEFSGLVAGTQIYSAPLVAAPTALPQGRVSYDEDGKLLKVTGWLTATERSGLLEHSQADDYEKAVDVLYQRPRDLIPQFLVMQLGWTTEDDVLKAISIGASELNSALTASKFGLTLTGILPHLRNAIGRAFVKQTLAEAFALEPATASLILEGIGRVVPIGKNDRPAIADFLELTGDGLSAKYFSNRPGGPPSRESVDPTIDFRWHSKQAFRVIWQGQLLPDKSQRYQFHLRVTGGVQLTLDDELVINQPAHHESAEYSFEKDLQADKSYEIVVEYAAHAPAAANTGSALVELRWSGPATPLEIIPSYRFYSTIRTVGQAPAKETFIRLYKASLLVNGFKLSPREVAYLTQPKNTDGTSAHPNALDLNDLPVEQASAGSQTLFAAWEKWNDFTKLRSFASSDPVSLLDLFTATNGDQAQLALLRATSWDEHALIAVAGEGFALTPDYKDATTLLKLANAVKLLGQLGASPSEVFRYTDTLLARTGIIEDGVTKNDASLSSASGAFTDSDLNRVVEGDGIPYGTKILTVEGPTAVTLSKATTAKAVGVRVQIFGAPPNEVLGWAGIFRDTSRVIHDGKIKKNDSLSSDTAGFDEKDLGRIIEGLDIPDFTTITGIVSATEVTLSNSTTATATDVRVNIYSDNQAARTAAQEAKRAHKAQYDNESWLEVARPIADQLREDQRSALVAYLMPRLGLKDAGQLFEYFLIDVEMSPCMQTSRIKQAISSVQLFIQRCRMNLERSDDPKKDVDPRTIDPTRWQWMQNYRVWEANLKIFIYPENWIESQLRDDKTPFFRQLESDLLQAEMTSETAEIAIGKYLENLETVSNVKVCGLFEEDSFNTDENRESILHVFGRTCAAPYVFYYRQLVTVNPNYRYWTAWEKVPLDLEAEEVLPVIWNRRLYLFWQVVAEKTDSATKVPYYSVRLAWSEHRNGKWSAKHVSPANQAIATPDTTFRLGLKFLGHELTVLVETQSERELSGGAKFASRFFGSLTFLNTHGLVLPKNVPVKNFQYSGFLPRQTGSDYEFVPSAYPIEKPVPVFGSIPGAIQAFTSGVLPYTLNDPFFIQEGPRSYLVMPQSSLLSEIERRVSSEVEVIIPSYQSDKGESGPSKEKGLVMFDSLSANAHPWLAGRAGIAATEMRAFSKPVAGGEDFAERHLSPASEIFQYSVSKGGGVAASKYPAEFRFETFFHPYAAEFQQRLQRYGVPALLNIDLQDPARLPGLTTFKEAYSPDWRTVKSPEPLHNVDFSFTGAYSQYNWELFFHVPLFIASCLSQNQRFEEAITWFHYIFNPTASGSQPVPERYWNVLPFTKTQPLRVDQLLKKMSDGDADLIAQWADLEAHPFQPHRVARLRLSAYQKTVVMKYIDNLIAWADQLFRRDTIESINQATQLYVLAAQVLGQRPQKMPARGRIKPQTYAQLSTTSGKLNLAMATFENDLPFSSRSTTVESPTETTGLMGIGRTFYFCIPQNDKLLGYWDTVADRLFKIRHCMNIEGIVRELPLFEPPIDPALLVRAAAQGIDLNSVLNDMSTPLPFYRFNTLLARAFELTNELRSLGAALLLALEKRDAEHLVNLRASHETELLSLVMQMKKQQLREAETAAQALEKSREVTQTRFDFYNNIQQQIDEEKKQLEELDTSQHIQETGQLESIVAESLIAPLTDISLGFSPSGESGAPFPTISFSAGRTNLIAMLQVADRARTFLASVHSFKSNRSSILAGWKRRSAEWKLQKDLAAKELTQIEKQITAAEIRVAIAQQDLDNTSRQIEQSQETQEFLRNKFTSEELYNWMAEGISSIFFQSYQMTYDLAKQAERCCRFELGLTTSNFVQFGAWDSQRKGLLAGERLYLQLKQMEHAYLNGNRREFELTKHYSLVLNDPQALINLKAQGKCEVTLPEELFDSDYSGHYMRRIKNVSLTIPAVVGPYAGVNCTLTLLKDKTRIKSTLGDGYAEREGEEDDRFATNWARMQAIATSSAQNDSGIFEINFRDERYLPFEGAGAVSKWRIEMDRESNGFDFNTLADVVLHVRYTARDGGERLKDAAKKALAQAIGKGAIKRQSRLFSLRHEFPTDWHQLTRTQGPGPFTGTFTLTKDRFPFLFRGKELTARKVSLYAVLKDGVTAADATSLAVKLEPPVPTVADRENPIKFRPQDKWIGILAPTVTPDVDRKIQNAAADAKWVLTVDPPNSPLLAEKFDDLLLVCEYWVGKHDG